MKEMHKMKGDKKQRIHLTMFQRNSLKFIQYYSINQFKTNGSFTLEQWLLIKRNEFEAFRISCNPFDYIPTPTTPINTIPTHDPIKEFMRDIKRDAVLDQNLKMTNNGLNGIKN